jgi:hypothetical protein
MSNPTHEPVAEPVVHDTNISQEIARSLSSIWQRRTGAKPNSINAEFRGDVVRCRIDTDALEPDTESSGYQHEACAAVTRIVRRKVSAYIASTDAKTGTTTQKFIFERIRVKY